MGKNKNADRALRQEEIWDDSALVQSWDEAVEEYKLYHSIHAKGENVEDVLREAEAADREMEHAEEPQADTAAGGGVMDAADVNPLAATSQQSAQEDVMKVCAPGDYEARPPTEAAPAGAPAMPHPALAQVQDEGLKNLMMAWYYAGYYTGLYEGQQRGNQNTSSS
ncbi:uncharacterized protein ACLA_045670 [Aspergillus clavatus NRRL 1]|uniref:Survival Motor Neuron Gemin2-binding domain-containing protein n=1 Tax=Aspergillus clavatus (strain ATCC 1007 / CBS 513.65 / DSM 816 / NCTC 3887 / NRRL 1 / QM 1276 / 107) TaxID=344612 RepID=A1CGU7_ASPCL|nr:uncharacterized protein ACLA_045670 [Aspergillus clavatus NRRL 1]EAW10102.1 conserved hypothetical protein [Aspergillus clavatus NRRL 1]